MQRSRTTFRARFQAVALLICIIPSVASYGQGEPVRYRPDVLRFADAVAYTYSAPARWDRRDWLILGGLVLGTSALTFADEPVRAFWLRQDNRFLNGLERIGYHYGKPYSAAGITAGMYLSGLLFKSRWARETGLMLGTSILSSSMVMGFLKNAAGRARPADPEMGNLEFRPFDRAPAFHAFPSGHSSIAFGISIVMARSVESVPLKVLFYSLAGSTAIGRMYSDSHWISDVAFGGMLAYFFADTAIGRIETNRFRKSRGAMKNQFVWKVYPYPGGVTLRATIGG